MSKRFYAIKKGRNTGIFENWCYVEKQVKGYSGAMFKGFNSLHAARSFLNNTDMYNSNGYALKTSHNRSKQHRFDATKPFKYASMRSGKVYKTTYPVYSNQLYKGFLPPW